MSIDIVDEHWQESR